MGEKCPYCGSRDTKISVLGVAGTTVGQTFRVAATAVGGILAHSIHPAAGHVTAEKIWEELDPNVSIHYCNKCHRKF